MWHHFKKKKCGLAARQIWGSHLSVLEVEQDTAATSMESSELQVGSVQLSISVVSSKEL